MVVVQKIRFKYFKVVSWKSDIALFEGAMKLLSNVSASGNTTRKYVCLLGIMCVRRKFVFVLQDLVSK